MGLVDVVWSFPTILLAIGLVAVLRPGLTSAMIALGLVTWPAYCRMMRAQVLSIREKEFVEAARSQGLTDFRVLVRHIAPNAISPIIVLATLGMASAILVESALSYLGLGAQPPAPSWGAMLSSGRNYIYRAPWLTVVPGVAIMLVVLGFNLCGDALRDALDPRKA
jgi:peptide/nickel transport system permease protein